MFKRSALVVLVIALAACGGGDDDANTQATLDSASVPAATPTPPAAPAMGDAEVAHVATTANTLDIDGGKLASTKATNAEVKKFAQHMVTDHTKSNEAATALAQKLNLTPADNSASQQMKTAHDQAKAELESKSGADFDKAYIAHEVDMHQKVLNDLDQTLIPAAQNAELKALLQQARGMVESHLKMAQDIQAKIGG